MKQLYLNSFVMALLLISGAAMVSMAMPISAQTTITHLDWGKTPDGNKVKLYTMTSGNIQVRVTNYGARLVSARTPDKNGKVADVVLGYNSLDAYVADTRTYSGATIGRYANRITKGRFSIDRHDYQIPPNDHGNALHGGPVGFDRRVWRVRPAMHGIEFTLLSPDGDQGFPGALTATVRYTLRGKVLRIDYSATTNKTTVVNFTNHSYFNLHGDDAGTILDHELTIYADRYTTEVTGLVPTGELATVDGTPLDFRKETVIGKRINEPNEQLRLGRGYDNNWVLDGKIGELHPAAKLVDSVSGRTLSIATTEPGIEFYTGNGLDGSILGRHGVPYIIHKGLCLETQHYADSPNHRNFPSTLLKPGETMHSTTILTFGVE